MLKTIKKFLSRSINKDINYKTATKLLKENDGILLDVRSKQEYEEGHIQGAINIPDYEIVRRVEKEIPKKNQSIVLYCQYGSRSKDAYIKMKKMGYTNVYNLYGGLDIL